ncbi:hypothetical protein H4R34_001513 [Dimargaris verticillata]|uniref:Fungal lipase-type domain-containing protein n=1 Tax=Dimargaris verticillata TaxID=2761393 RepID=A0A9W8B3G3_9FUNG|nr:hypothetical protein H4R34_001513 [Dimargaris verticillata]
MARDPYIPAIDGCACLCGLASTAPAGNTTTSEITQALPNSEKSSPKPEQKEQERPAKPTAASRKDSNAKTRDQKGTNKAILESTVAAKSNSTTQANKPEKAPTVTEASTNTSASPNTTTSIKERLSGKDYYNVWVDYMFAAYRINSPGQDVLSRSENTKNAKVIAAQGFDDYPTIRWYVAVDEVDKYVVVSFEGSDPDSLYLTALDIKRSIWPRGTQSKVHGGAIDGYLRLNEPLKQLHRQLMEKYPDYDHFIVGHSLGGLHAVYYAFEASEFLENKLADVVTLAQPRPGDEAFKELWDAKHIPYSPVGNQNDLIIYLPPSFLGFESLTSPILVSATSGSLINCARDKQALPRGSLCTASKPSELDIAAHGTFFANNGHQFGPKLSSRS